MTLHVAVLHQGRPGPADPIRACAWQLRGQLCRALVTLGCTPHPVTLDTEFRWADRLLRLRPDLVLNAADLGFFYDIGLEPHVAGVLEAAGLPYTGSPVEAGNLALDKFLSKQLLGGLGVAVPRFALASAPEGMTYPLIVKPRFGANSVGLTSASIVHRPEELSSQVRALGLAPDAVVLEAFIDGDELTAGFLGNAPRRLLPPFVIRYGAPMGFLDYAAKWLPDSLAYQTTIPVPAELPPALREKLDAAMLKVAEVTGMRDYGRCDFRVGVGPDGEATPFLLDINSNCDVSDGAGLSNMARAAGLDHAGLIGKIIDAALARYAGRPPRRAPRGAPRRVGMLPRGIDGLLLAAPGVEVFALVEADTPMEAWSRALYGDRTLPYVRTGGDDAVYPSTAELLGSSTLGAAMVQGGVRELLLPSACSPEIRTWAHQTGVTLLATDDGDRHDLENKLTFHRLLERLDLPRPRGGPWRVGSGRLPIDGPAVVQVPRSLGGEGTFFVSGAADVAALVAAGRLVRGERVLVRERVMGVPYGITVFVAPGHIALSAVRRQCTEPAVADTLGPLTFAGVQWVPTAALPFVSRVEEVCLRLGDALHKRRFSGFANLDFVLGEAGEVWLIECNPRLSAATPQLLRHPETIGVSVVEGFLGAAGRFLPHPARFGLPPSRFAGASMDLIARADGPLRRAHASGRYAQDGDGLRWLGPEVTHGALALVWFARAGQVAQLGDTLGTLLAEAPLFADEGLTALGAVARAALE